MDFVRDTSADGAPVPRVDAGRRCDAGVPAAGGRSVAARGAGGGGTRRPAPGAALPEVIVCDNGPEFVSQALDQWASQHGVTLDFIRPGHPVENVFIESFNGKLRDECLSQYHFASLAEARTASSSGASNTTPSAPIAAWGSAHHSSTRPCYETTRANDETQTSDANWYSVGGNVSAVLVERQRYVDAHTMHVRDRAVMRGNLVHVVLKSARVAIAQDLNFVEYLIAIPIVRRRLLRQPDDLSLWTQLAPRMFRIQTRRLSASQR